MSEVKCEKHDRHQPLKVRKIRYLVFTFRALCSLASLTSATYSNAQEYSLTILGATGSGDSSAAGINNLGLVVGYGLSNGSSNPHAFAWSNGAAFDLGTIGGSSSSAKAVNDAGQIVGAVYFADGSPTRGATWQIGSSASLLPTSPSTFLPMAINQSGLIAGQVDSSSAVIWNGSSLQSLGTLPDGTASYAYGINAQGEVAGWANILGQPGGWAHATLWNGTKLIDLSAVTNNFIASSIAYAVNNSEQVVGSSSSNPGITPGRATLWSGTSQTDLGTNASLGSVATSINNHGAIVGATRNSIDSTYATLWSNSSSVDLNMFAIGSGWILKNAISINDRGMIVGDATNSLTGQTKAYLLTPLATPLPESFGLMFVGLGGLGFAGRRKQ